MVNKVTLIGRLGKDPEVRRLESGAVVAIFTMATSESYRDKNEEWQERTEWHNIVVWRYLAERAERDLKKGKLIYLEGKLTHRKYQTAEGQDRYITEVVGNNFRLLEKREGTGFQNSFPAASDEPSSAQQSSTNGGNTSAPAPESTNQQPEEVTDATGDDLPF